ncbi:MAG: dihydroorotase [Bacillales bacterium]|nr:dihydroorotase [Bacillales bacterium]
MLVIKNGYIIENNNLVKKDILVIDGKIASIEDSFEGDYEVLDVEGCLIIPGAVDVHVHLREPGYEKKETVLTGTRSASKGGVTCIMPMPNLNPCPDNKEALLKQLEIIKKDSCVKAYPYASLSVGEGDQVLSDIENMHELVSAITDDGRGVNNLELLEKAMILAKKYDLVIASHAEDNYYKTSPEGEYIAVRREIELAKKIGCRYHFCHMSTKESFDAIRKARKEGYTNITCEVTPHHLVLNKDMIIDANWKMNPPLRSEEERLETINALIDGTAQVIASDHAPHTEEEKLKAYDESPNGIIGLETMIPIIYTELVMKKKISLDKFLDVMVYNPIKIFHLPKHGMYVGSPCDLAILDIKNPHTYTKEEILSKGKNSPFIGRTYYGFTKYTLIDGKIIYKA